MRFYARASASSVHQRHASALPTLFTYSLESKRHWPNQAKVRSMRRRTATGAKPFLRGGRRLGGDMQVTAKQRAGDFFRLALVAFVGGKLSSEGRRSTTATMTALGSAPLALLAAVTRTAKSVP